jgi:hypothetical protein
MCNVYRGKSSPKIWATMYVIKKTAQSMYTNTTQ